MTHDSQTSLPELQHALAGKYVLERPLGRGGMGIVYLARELRLDRRVAIKLLPPPKGVDPVARQRFLHEARTAAQFSHPNIVPIYAVHEVGEFVFFAMAYVEGDTLGQRIRELGPLGPAEGARVLQEVACALAYAHARGVVHRDVKPDNILLDAATGRALVSDFGIARVSGGGAGGTTGGGPREVVGTAEFMSPEQASGSMVDGRSDLYSLGVVGYYALSGCLPFEAPDSYELLARHIAEPPPRLASLAPDVPRRLAEVIDRCLAKDPEARFASGADLADALGAAVTRPAPPVAVRAFLVQSTHLSGPALVYVALAGLAVPLLVLRLLVATEHAPRLLAAGCIAWLLLLPAGVLLSRVRRLRRAGFDWEDLVEAIEEEWARRREELAFLYGEGPSGFERALRWVAYAGVAAAGVVVGVPLVVPAGLRLPAFAALAGVALIAAVLARARTAHRTDPKSERRLRFWRGPLGRWLFKIAGPGRRPRADAVGGAAAGASEAWAERLSPEMAVGAVVENGRGR